MTDGRNEQINRPIERAVYSPSHGLPGIGPAKIESASSPEKPVSPEKPREGAFLLRAARSNDLQGNSLGPFSASAHTIEVPAVGSGNGMADAVRQIFSEIPT